MLNVSSLIQKFRTKYANFEIRFPVYLGMIFFSVLILLFFFFDVTKILNRSSEKTSLSSDNLTLLAETGVNGIATESSPSINGSGNYTSLLVVGIDSRDVVVKNGEFVNTKPEGQAGTRNSDTIIQAVFDHRDDKVFLISIPRDMGVDVREDCITFSGSIHWVYDKAQRKKNCEGGGIGVLARTVENITGIPVNYHAFITLDTFQDIIKTVGIKDANGKTGIVVDNPRSFSDIYPSSDEKGWESVYFPKGQLFLSPYRALQFARTRQYTSDFDRANRQQLIIQTVLKSVLNANTLLDPTKLSALLETYKTKTLISEPQSLGEWIKLIDIAGRVDTDKITKLVLSPELGGHEKYLDKQPHGRPGGPYYMVPKAWKECPGDEFCKVKEYILQIMDDPNLYINEDK